MEVKSMFKKMIAIATSLSVSLVTLLSAVPVYAESGNTAVTGKLYEFGEKSKYEISSAETFSATTSANTYGEFLIDGNVVSSSTKDGVPSYEIEDNALSFIYQYDDTLLNAGVDEWHLYSDDTKEINGKDIEDKVQKGAIWVQTSIDHINWTDAVCITNAFATTPTNSDAFYTARDIELINGCYYKVVIAYETRIRTENSNFLFIDTDKFDYKKYAEVYEFYAFTDTGEQEVIDYNQTYNMGNKVCVKEFDGYFGQKDMDKDDIHYGWDLGNFFVSGYTDKRVNDNGNVVFLKNVDDRVTLWFNLSQDMNKLNGKDNLSVTSDAEGFDKYFETPRTDFGKGALIIRYTDYNNNKTEPQIYTNYLAANTSFGADTKVQLFEEGDYEVALDYEVTEDNFIDKEGHYRIFFKFSVRNGNCMVYPFDVATGSELTNSSMTENGFHLDLAKSRYLKVNVKREVMKDSTDGLVEDTRFNAPAKDGEEYTDEGIYTITVSNDYTNQSTVKKIYVGTNNILRAYMTTGLSIPEINNLVAEGATILEDGTIKLAEKVVETEVTTETNPTTEQPTETTPTTEEAEEVMSDVTQNADKNSVLPFVIIGIVVVAVAGGIAVAVMVKKKKSEDISENKEGGNEE